MSDRTEESEGDITSTIPEMLKRSLQMSTNLMMRSYIDSFDPPAERPYKWRWDHDEVLAVNNYRSAEIKTVRDFWRPPEKKRESVGGNFGSFFTSGYTKPEGLDENNSRVAFHTRDFEYPDRPKQYKSWKSVEDAQQYIDYQLSLDARKDELVPIVAFLKDMPCTCGEYDQLNDREYLYNAEKLLEVVRGKAN